MAEVEQGQSETRSQRDRRRGYREEEWEKGIDLYKCLTCRYDTMDEPLMQQHQQLAHPDD